MKYCILFVIALMFCVQVSYSQTCQWAEKVVEGKYYEEATSIATDISGNIYVAGWIDYGNLDNDGFIAKYNSLGIFQWVQMIKGRFNARIKSIVVDGLGNIYVAGQFESYLTFNNGIKLESSGGDLEIFFAKYNSMGSCQWAEKINGNSYSIANSIAVDFLGNIIIVGTYEGPYITFNNGIKLTSNSYTTSDCYVVKYNSSGTCQWAERIFGKDDDYLSSVAVDHIGNIYLAGTYFSETISFNNNISLINSNYSNREYTDAYIAKYSPSGTCEWAQGICGNDWDCTNYIIIDNSNNLYISGDFESSTLRFNNNISIKLKGNKDAYVAKYNSKGTCQWGEAISGDKDDFATSLAVDSTGNVYVTGYSESDTLKFNNGKTLSSNNISVWQDYDAYITKYNPNGTCLWAEYICGSKMVMAYSTAVDLSGNAYIAGLFNSPIITFNNGISLSNIDSNNWDSYIAKYIQTPISVPYNNVLNSNISILPTPNNGSFTLRIDDLANMEMDLIISNSIGQEVYKDKLLTTSEVFTKELNLSGISSGIYFLKLRFGDREIVKKIVVEK